jgi:hypothetical protein
MPEGLEMDWTQHACRREENKMWDTDMYVNNRDRPYRGTGMEKVVERKPERRQK